jgi:hypothetical protein
MALLGRAIRNKSVFQDFGKDGIQTIGELVHLRPNFEFTGVCTACYKRGPVVQVVKASVVRSFLEEVFGPAP